MEKQDVTMEVVRIGEFGCKHCLWNGCECRDASRYLPAVTADGQPTCEAYAYYD